MPAHLPVKPRYKNKTVATALAFLLGGVGAHRFYLQGSVDRLGLLHVCSIPLAGLVYGVGRAPNPFYVLLPVLLSCIAGFIEALVLGLTPDDKWNARHNPTFARHAQSRWPLVLLCCCWCSTCSSAPPCSSPPFRACSTCCTRAAHTADGKRPLTGRWYSSCSAAPAPVACR